MAILRNRSATTARHDSRGIERELADAAELRLRASSTIGGAADRMSTQWPWWQSSMIPLCGL
jgi:hypothetical protein